MRKRTRQDERRRKPKGSDFSKRRGGADKRSKTPRQDGPRTLKLKAVVDKNRKGFAFLIFEDKRRKLEDAFVPPGEANHLFQGDRVEVTFIPPKVVLRIQVLEHRFKEVVGRFVQISRQGPNPSRGGAPSKTTGEGRVVYERKRTREEIYVPPTPGFNPNTGEWVRIRLQFHEKGPHPVTGEILDVYGEELPASADVSMVSAEYNLTEKHTALAVQEAERSQSITEDDLKGRADLRKLPFITIDGETARDFDDAVYVERKKSGYMLWVAIADVSHYVREGTELDAEARARGTSVYFPERAFHMLPGALSENLCSLKPHVTRLALVAQIEFDFKGQPLSTKLMEASIESKRRATYNEIEAEWKKSGKNPNWEFEPHFALYQALRKSRTDRGSIDFELPEAETKVDPQGEMISIENRQRLDAHRLIEEFMIAANEAVTRWMMEKGLPFVYRIHEEPSEEALQRFRSLAATVGFNVSFEKSRAPKIMADLVRKLEGHAAQSLLNMALLRSMKQAIYSATHGIHYGLASQAYTHFTSPIRRYPDLVVHRQIRNALRSQKKLNDTQRATLEQSLADICEHCSYRERLAADAERESIRLKQVRAMKVRLGEDFDAQVIGMAGAGLFVQILSPYVEGLVPAESIGVPAGPGLKVSVPQDEYVFDEEKMVFYGRRKKKWFKIGDRFQVRVVRADLDRRQIEFQML